MAVAAYLKEMRWTVLYRCSSAGGFWRALPGDKGFTDVQAGRGYFIYLTSAGTLATEP